MSAAEFAGSPHVQDPLVKLTPQELIGRNEVYSREEVIPLFAVIADSSLTDTQHATDLGLSIEKSGRGQISPIVVRARISEEDPFQPVYDVIDGFHRTAGQKALGKSKIKATVLYGCNDEEMWDLRILAANSVKAVQFPRMAEWLARSYESSKWADSGLSLPQIFALAVNDSTRANNARQLAPDEVTELKDWVREKCIKWDKTPVSVYSTLRIVENADPDLVKQVRSQRGGRKDHKAELSPALIRVIVSAYPGEAYYATQRAIAKAALERKLTEKETLQLMQRSQKFLTTEMGEDEIYDTIKKIPVTHDVFPTPADNEHEDNDPLSLLEGIQLDLSHAYTPPHSLTEKPHNGHSEKRTKHAAPIDSAERDLLTNRIKELERQVAVLQQTQDAYWWKNAEYLDPNERKLLTLLFETPKTIYDIAQIIGKSEALVLRLTQNCFSKRRLQLKQFGLDSLSMYDQS